MKKSFRFNPESDLHVVDTVLAGVDLRKAYVNGVVPSGVVGSSLEFNDVEDPSTIMVRPRDSFEAMRQAEHVKDALKSRASKEAASAESGAATV